MEVELYVKEHNKTGMKYFGKHKVCQTSVSDYLGSGSEWIEHLKEHGDDVTTHLVGKWDETDPELEYAALSISDLFDIVKSDEWANMKPENGHDGGWEYVNSLPRTWDTITPQCLEASRRAQTWLEENDQEWVLKKSKSVSDVVKKFYQNGGVTFKGKKHTEKTKNQMRISAKGMQQGSKNSQYGTMWITNETESKKIQKDQDIPDGWRKGRKIKMSD